MLHRAPLSPMANPRWRWIVVAVLFLTASLLLTDFFVVSDSAKPASARLTVLPHVANTTPGDSALAGLPPSAGAAAPPHERSLHTPTESSLDGDRAAVDDDDDRGRDDDDRGRDDDDRDDDRDDDDGASGGDPPAVAEGPSSATTHTRTDPDGATGEAGAVDAPEVVAGSTLERATPPQRPTSSSPSPLPLALVERDTLDSIEFGAREPFVLPPDAAQRGRLLVDALRTPLALGMDGRLPWMPRFWLNASGVCHAGSGRVASVPLLFHSRLTPLACHQVPASPSWTLHFALVHIPKTSGRTFEHVPEDVCRAPLLREYTDWFSRIVRDRSVLRLRGLPSVFAHDGDKPDPALKKPLPTATATPTSSVDPRSVLPPLPNPNGTVDFLPIPGLEHEHPDFQAKDEEDDGEGGEGGGEGEEDDGEQGDDGEGEEAVAEEEDANTEEGEEENEGVGRGRGRRLASRKRPAPGPKPAASTGGKGVTVRAPTFGVLRKEETAPKPTPSRTPSITPSASRTPKPTPTNSPTPSASPSSFPAFKVGGCTPPTSSHPTFARLAGLANQRAKCAYPGTGLFKGAGLPDPALETGKPTDVWVTPRLAQLPWMLDPARISKSSPDERCEHGIPFLFTLVRDPVARFQSQFYTSIGRVAIDSLGFLEPCREFLPVALQERFLVAKISLDDFISSLHFQLLEGSRARSAAVLCANYATGLLGDPTFALPQPTTPEGEITSTTETAEAGSEEPKEGDGEVVEDGREREEGEEGGSEEEAGSNEEGGSKEAGDGKNGETIGEGEGTPTNAWDAPTTLIRPGEVGLGTWGEENQEAAAPNEAAVTGSALVGRRPRADEDLVDEIYLFVRESLTRLAVRQRERLRTARVPASTLEERMRESQEEEPKGFIPLHALNASAALRWFPPLSGSPCRPMAVLDFAQILRQPGSPRAVGCTIARALYVLRYRLHFIGLAERVSESVALLALASGRLPRNGATVMSEFNAPWYGGAAQGRNFVPPPAINARTLKLIAELTMPDRIVYEHARLLYAEQRERLLRLYPPWLIPEVKCEAAICEEEPNIEKGRRYPWLRMCEALCTFAYPYAVEGGSGG